MFASMVQLHTQHIRFAAGSLTNDRWIGWCRGMGVGRCNGLKICWLTFPNVLGLARSLGWLYETFWDSNDLMAVFPNCSGTASVPIQHVRGSALAGSRPARGLPGGSPLASWWLSPCGFPVVPAARPAALAGIAVSRPLRIGRTFSFGIRCGMSETPRAGPRVPYAGFNAGSVISY